MSKEAVAVEDLDHVGKAIFDALMSKVTSPTPQIIRRTASAASRESERQQAHPDDLAHVTKMTRAVSTDRLNDVVRSVSGLAGLELNRALSERLTDDLPLIERELRAMVDSARQSAADMSADEKKSLVESVTPTSAFAGMEMRNVDPAAFKLLVEQKKERAAIEAVPITDERLKKIQGRGIIGEECGRLIAEVLKTQPFVTEADVRSLKRLASNWVQQMDPDERKRRKAALKKPTRKEAKREAKRKTALHDGDYSQKPQRKPGTKPKTYKSRRRAKRTSKPPVSVEEQNKVWAKLNPDDSGYKPRPQSKSILSDRTELAAKKSKATLRTDLKDET